VNSTRSFQLGAVIACLAPALPMTAIAGPPGAAGIMVALKETEAGQNVQSRDYVMGRGLGIDGEASHGFDVEKGKTYLVLGACDHACGDIEVVVEDAAGHVLGNDEADEPFVVFAPEKVGRVSVILTMNDCGEDACSYGLGFYALATGKTAPE
jgi:hypothetical protein